MGKHTQDNELAARLAQFCQKHELKTNREISHKLNMIMYEKNISPMRWVSHGLVGKVRRTGCTSPKLRHALGLKPLGVIAVPCRVCGVVHQLKSCPLEKRKKRYRVAFEFDTEEEQKHFIDMLSLLGATRKEQANVIQGLLSDLP